MPTSSGSKKGGVQNTPPGAYTLIKYLVKILGQNQGRATFQTPPTPSPVVSPAALSFIQK